MFCKCNSGKVRLNDFGPTTGSVRFADNFVPFTTMSFTMNFLELLLVAAVGGAFFGFGVVVFSLFTLSQNGFYIVAFQRPLHRLSSAD